MRRGFSLVESLEHAAEGFVQKAYRSERGPLAWISPTVAAEHSFDKPFELCNGRSEGEADSGGLFNPFQISRHRTYEAKALQKSLEEISSQWAAFRCLSHF